MRKVDELMREVVAEEVGRLKDPRIGFVTVTGVDTSPDLRRATVFYTALGTDEEQAGTAAALAHAAPHLQQRVAAQVRMKFTPVLTFAVDEAVERGLRLSRILHELEQEPPVDFSGKDGE
jgi:ribosome-binding factor A